MEAESAGTFLSASPQAPGRGAVSMERLACRTGRHTSECADKEGHAPCTGSGNGRLESPPPPWQSARAGVKRVRTGRRRGSCRTGDQDLRYLGDRRRHHTQPVRRPRSRRPATHQEHLGGSAIADPPARFRTMPTPRGQLHSGKYVASSVPNTYVPLCSQRARKQENGSVDE